MESDI